MMGSAGLGRAGRISRDRMRWGVADIPRALAAVDVGLAHCLLRKRASREVSSRASWWVVQVKTRTAIRHERSSCITMHSKTALQQRSDTRFLRGLCAPLAHLIVGGCRVGFWSATTSVVIEFGVAALCADLAKLALGLGALAEYMEEGRGRFGEFDIHSRGECLEKIRDG